MRKRCKRKVYALVNPIEYAIEGARVASQERLDKLRALELSAIDAFARGQATIHDWHAICQMMNLAEVMAKAGVGIEVLDAAMDAQSHLIDAKDRFERLKRMGTTGAGLQSFRMLYDYHDLQRTSISLSEYERFIKRTRGLVAGKAPGVVELT